MSNPKSSYANADRVRLIATAIDQAWTANSDRLDRPKRRRQLATADRQKLAVSATSAITWCDELFGQLSPLGLMAQASRLKTYAKQRDFLRALRSVQQSLQDPAIFGRPTLPVLTEPTLADDFWRSDTYRDAKASLQGLKQAIDKVLATPAFRVNRKGRSSGLREEEDYFFSFVSRLAKAWQATTHTMAAATDDGPFHRYVRAVIRATEPRGIEPNHVTAARLRTALRQCSPIINRRRT